MREWMVNRLVDGEYRWEPLTQEVIDKIRKGASEDLRGMEGRGGSRNGMERKGRKGAARS